MNFLTKKRSWTNKAILALIVPLFLADCTTGKQITRDQSFNYKSLIDQGSTDNTKGDYIFLTLEKGETFSGSISSDNHYLYYTSNQNGDFDIYLRDLKDIISLPIVSGATNQTEPMISPDGKTIVFVDDQLDPQGDLAILEVNPEKAIALYLKRGNAGLKSLYYGKKKFITNNPEALDPAKDGYPTWSPNGKSIAYASSKSKNPSERNSYNSAMNIWIVDPFSPEKKKMITTEGGIMPSFSPDGKRLLYVGNLNRKAQGDIFEIDLASGKTRQITSGRMIDLSPSYSNNGRTVVFTRISRDTNKDGAINQKDKGQIVAIDITRFHPEKKQPLPDQSQIYPLTAGEENIFNSRYSPFQSGVILFAAARDNNINLAIIPASGIIPGKDTITEQYRYATTAGFATTYLAGMAHLQTTRLHSQSPLYPLISAESQLALLESGQNTSGAVQELSTLAEQGFLYPKMALDLIRIENNYKPANYTFIINTSSQEQYLKQILSNWDTIIEEFPDEKERLASSLYRDTLNGLILEKLARVLEKKGKRGEGADLKSTIVLNHPSYFRNGELLFEMGSSGLETDLSPELIFIAAPNSQTHTLLLQSLFFRQKSINGNQEANGENGKQLPVSEKTSLERLKNSIYELVTIKAKNEIKNFIRKKMAGGQTGLVEQLLEKYSSNEYSGIRTIILTGIAERYLIDKKTEQAEKALSQISTQQLSDSGYQHQYHYTMGALYEALYDPDKAFMYYTRAILYYNKNEKLDYIFPLISRTLEYYKEKIVREKRKNNPDVVIGYYDNIIKILIQLYSKGLTNPYISHLSSEIFIQLDEFALAHDPGALKGEILEKMTTDLYSRYLPEAKKHLMTPLLFGKAYYTSALAIKLHQYYEKVGLINFGNKEKVLKLFREAEHEFQWSIFADPSYAEPFIMLSWMYQFIDEKRESILYQKGDKTAYIRDRDFFERLYQKYFPDFLYEKNIQLFHKSLAFLPDDAPESIRQSYYLNLANNYFLLSNYGKAEEYYGKIIGNRQHRFLFENRLQEAQYYFHYGKSSFFNSHYLEARTYLEKALSFYRITRRTKPEQKPEILSKREIILRYLALSMSEGGNYKKAIEYYERVLRENRNTDQISYKAMIYLELARLSYQQAKIYSDLEYTDKAITYITHAEAELLTAPPVRAPRFHTKFRLFGVTVPFIAIPNSYDKFYKVGDNKLAFPLPTVNLYQYLYSVKADLMKMQGKYTESIEAIEQLIEYATKDKTTHGRETYISALARAAEIHYSAGNHAEAKKTYEEVLKLAIDKDNFSLMIIAKKNLLTIACKTIENLKAPLDQKIKITQQELEDLYTFKDNFIKQKVEKATKEARSKNKHIELSESEIIQMEIAAHREIYQILNYSGVLEGFLAIFTEQKWSSENKSVDFNTYINQKKGLYTLHTRSLQSLTGEVNVRSEKLFFLDKFRDRKTFMLQDLNKGLVLEQMGRYDEAIKLYEKLYYRSYEYRADTLYVIAGFRYARLLEKNDKKKAITVYQNIDKTFRNNPYLAQTHPELYHSIIKRNIETQIAEKNYLDAIYLENYRRHSLLRERLKALLASQKSEIFTRLNYYDELEKVSGYLRKQIENLRIQRLSASEPEKLLSQLKERKEKLLRELLADPRLSAQSIALYTDLTEKGQITRYPFSFIFIRYQSGSLELYEKTAGSDQVRFRRENLDPKQLRKFIRQSLNGNQANDNQTDIQQLFVKLFMNKSPEVVFIDHGFEKFPFQLYFKNRFSIDYTFQSALMFRNNKNVSSNRWLQAGKNPVDPAPMVASIQTIEVRESKGLNPEQDDLAWFNTLDVNLDNSEQLSGLPVITGKGEKQNSPSLAIISGEDLSSETIGVLNLFFSAAGFSRVLFTATDRKNYTPAIKYHLNGDRGQPAPGSMISGNPAIIDAWYNYLEKQNPNPLLALFNTEKERATTRYQRLLEEGQHQEAGKELERAINAEIQIKTILNNNATEQISPPSVPFNLLSYRWKLMFSLKQNKEALEQIENHLNKMSQNGETHSPDESSDLLSLYLSIRNEKEGEQFLNDLLTLGETTGFNQTQWRQLFHSALTRKIVTESLFNESEISLWETALSKNFPELYNEITPAINSEKLPFVHPDDLSAELNTDISVLTLDLNHLILETTSSDQIPGRGSVIHFLLSDQVTQINPQQDIFKTLESLIQSENLEESLKERFPGKSNEILPVLLFMKGIFENSPELTRQGWNKLEKTVNTSPYQIEKITTLLTTVFALHHRSEKTVFTERSLYLNKWVQLTRSVETWESYPQLVRLNSLIEAESQLPASSEKVIAMADQLPAFSQYNRLIYIGVLESAIQRSPESFSLLFQSTETPDQEAQKVEPIADPDLIALHKKYLPYFESIGTGEFIPANHNRQTASLLIRYYIANGFPNKAVETDFLFNRNSLPQFPETTGSIKGEIETFNEGSTDRFQWEYNNGRYSIKENVSPDALYNPDNAEQFYLLPSKSASDITFFTDLRKGGFDMIVLHPVSEWEFPEPVKNTEGDDTEAGEDSVETTPAYWNRFEGVTARDKTIEALFRINFGDPAENQTPAIFYTGNGTGKIELMEDPLDSALITQLATRKPAGNFLIAYTTPSAYQAYLQLLNALFLEIQKGKKDVVSLFQIAKKELTGQYSEEILDNIVLIYK